MLELGPDIIWGIPQTGFWYNDGNAESIERLRQLLIQRGFGTTIICHIHHFDDGPCLFYTPADTRWTPVE